MGCASRNTYGRSCEQQKRDTPGQGTAGPVTSEIARSRAFQRTPRGLPASGSPATDAARKAILDCIRAACHARLADALAIQARHSAEFMGTSACKRGRIGSDYSETMAV